MYKLATKMIRRTMEQQQRMIDYLYKMLLVEEKEEEPLHEVWHRVKELEQDNQRLANAREQVIQLTMEHVEQANQLQSQLADVIQRIKDIQPQVFNVKQQLSSMMKAGSDAIENVGLVREDYQTYMELTQTLRSLVEQKNVLTQQLHPLITLLSSHEQRQNQYFVSCNEYQDQTFDYQIKEFVSSLSDAFACKTTPQQSITYAYPYTGMVSTLINDYQGLSVIQHKYFQPRNHHIDRIVARFLC